MKRTFLYLLPLLFCTFHLVSCQEDIIRDDPNMRLSFSRDTVCFDTVFTGIGSATQQVKIYNPNRNAVLIDYIRLDSARWFRINVDGENDPSRLHDIELRGGDSLYAFIEVRVDPLNVNSPVLIEDAIQIGLNGHSQSIHLEAYGQDVHVIRSAGRMMRTGNYRFENDKPYLIFDTVVVEGKLSIDPGSSLYMHDGSVLYALGNVDAQGTAAYPIRIQGSRRDRLFDSVPYRYAAGQWGGFYMVKGEGVPIYVLDHIEITSGNVGLYCMNDDGEHRPHLSLHNSLIHNHALYGLVLQNVDADVVNTEISNAASYCVYLAGGNHEITHSTIASYFNSTNIRVQSTSRQDDAALYINDLSKRMVPTRLRLRNSIVTGVRRNQWLLATPFPEYYPEEVYGNYLKTDTLAIPHAWNNVYWQAEDTAKVFRNDYYEYKVYQYYDFRLDSLSPARGIGDSICALSYPTDRLGNSRVGKKPDAGCYQYTE